MCRDKQKHAGNENASLKWAVTQAVSKKICLSCGEERKMPESVHTALWKSYWWKWDAVFLLQHPLPLSPLSPAASGLCLRDANCFCYLCQVPTLPQHILQTGPGPSAAFCVCLRGKKNVHSHLWWARHCSTPPPPGCGCHSATMMHIHVLSQRKKKKKKKILCGSKKTKLTYTIANMKQNNSRGSCFDV